MLLNMSVASHCPILQRASEELVPLLEQYLKDEFGTPVISNATSEAYSNKSDAIALLKQQLISPVRYKQSIANNADGVDAFVEFGNGSV